LIKAWIRDGYVKKHPDYPAKNAGSYGGFSCDGKENDKKCV